MTKTIVTFICDDCGQEFDYTEGFCPQCGSKNLTKYDRRIENESFNIRDKFEVKAKNDALPSKKKIVFEYQQGFDRSQVTESGYVQKERLIDRKNDKYKEVVKDDNGKIIHHCEEPLSDHYGHGTAKKI